MTTNNHQITPPPELVEDWIELAKPLPQRPPNPGEFATLAACWGADQELEACLVEVSFFGSRVLADKIRNTRRPTLPSLKDRIAAAITDGDERKALKLLEELDDSL